MSGNDTTSNLSPFYTVTISAVVQGNTTTIGGPIVARISKKFTFSLLSTWQPLISDKATNPLMQWALSGADSSMINLYSTAQVWMGTQPLRFSLPLEFVAQNSTFTDVIVPIQSLGKLVLPYIGAANFLTPPGPRMALNGTVTSGVIISIQIGNFLYFKNMIIESIKPDIECQFDATGYPMRAVVVTNCSTFFVATAGDMDTIFTGAGGGVGP